MQTKERRVMCRHRDTIARANNADTLPRGPKLPWSGFGRCPREMDTRTECKTCLMQANQHVVALYIEGKERRQYRERRSRLYNSRGDKGENGTAAMRKEESGTIQFSGRPRARRPEATQIKGRRRATILRRKKLK